MATFLSDDGLLYVWQKLKALLAGKVDKEEGKGLSTNDFTTAEKTKLSGIATGANKYTHPTYTSRTSGLYKITVDTSGHVSAATAAAKSDITKLGIPAQDTTYDDFEPASASAAGASGLVPAPEAGEQSKYLRGDGTWATPTNTTYSTMTGATSSAAGKSGLVPAPAAGTQNKYLRGDGTWQTPPNTTYSVATTSANGLMSKTDKAKLDAVPTPSTLATQTYVAQQVAAAGHIKKSIVSSLPSASSAQENVIYMVPKTSGSGSQSYDEYMKINGAMEKIGDTQTTVTAISNAEIDTIFAS